MRAIGSDESPAVRSQLEHLRALLPEALAPAAQLPWAFDVFVDKLGIEASQVSYVAEDAFSFGFARDIYSARLADESELFMAVRADPGDAKAFAAELVGGFSKLGAVNNDVPGATWVQDRYLNSFATAIAVDRWVVGVRAAPNAESATASLSRLRAAIEDLDPATRKRAVPAAAAATPDKPALAPDEDSDTEDSDEPDYEGDE